MTQDGGSATGGAGVRGEDVILRDAGANPAAVAEAVRSMTGLELPAARDLVARAPSVLRARVSPALAEALRNKLVALGATVEVRPHEAAPALFDVFLRDYGGSKIQVVRVVKMALDLGLREAIELVDEVPTILRRKVDRDEAEGLRRELAEAGADVEVRPHDPATPEPVIRSFEAPAPSPVSAAASPARDEPGEFGVMLYGYGDNKIAVIRVIREATGLGLREAKELAETALSKVKEGVSEGVARRIERELVAAGAPASIYRCDAPRASGSSSRATSVDLVLTGCGPNKILVIKLIRELTGLGLADCKNMAETPGSTVKAGLPREEAGAIARRFVEAGAVVELRGDDGEADVDDAEGGTVAVFLRSCGPNKISVIKEVRALTNLGLKEVVDLVESAPCTIREGVEREAALEVQRRLHEVGAVVELLGDGDERDEPESDTVEVFLRAHGPNKISVIKEVRALSGLGLKEAKDLVESAPCTIQEDVDREAAEELQRRLHGVGAIVELR